MAETTAGQTWVRHDNLPFGSGVLKFQTKWPLQVSTGRGAQPECFMCESRLSLSYQVEPAIFPTRRGRWQSAQ